MTKFNFDSSGLSPELISFLDKEIVALVFKELKNNEQIQFGELKQKLGTTTKILVEIFRRMNIFGLIIKHRSDSFPPLATFSLSNRGHNCLDLLEKLEVSSKKSRKEENPQDEQYLTKTAIILAIEKSLLEMGSLELERVKDQLLSKFNCTFEDCVGNPTPLKKVLCELFGNCYKEIYHSMNYTLMDTSMNKDTERFLQIMKM